MFQYWDNCKSRLQYSKILRLVHQRLHLLRLHSQLTNYNLFLAYINDITSNIHSQLKLFAKDCMSSLLPNKLIRRSLASYGLMFGRRSLMLRSAVSYWYCDEDPCIAEPLLILMIILPKEQQIQQKHTKYLRLVATPAK